MRARACIAGNGAGGIGYCPKFSGIPVLTTRIGFYRKMNTRKRECGPHIICVGRERILRFSRLACKPCEGERTPASEKLESTGSNNVTHWHRMNGTAGCTPGSNEIYESRADGIRAAIDMFGDGSMCAEHTSAFCYDIAACLLNDADTMGWTFGFDSDCENESPMGGTCSAGADYVSVTPCDDEDCEEDSE